MRVLMTGGGTGGHVNPAIAIADTIRENIPGAAIAFVGTNKGIENKLVPEAGYSLLHVNVMGLRRSLSIKNIKAAYLALTSPAKAKRIIRQWNPDIVIGTGGYVSWPVVKAAAGMGIPTALHESNAVPGMAVKMLAGVVDRIYLNFMEAGAELHCPEKLLHVGCPLRKGFVGISRERARKELDIPEDTVYVLSYGGSLGAEKVNAAVLDLMEHYTGGREGVFHYHATGSIEKEIAAGWFRERKLDRFQNLQLTEYIYDMPRRMAAADVVICRAGAMTISELAAAGKCAVLIPSPNVTNNQQYKNARVLADKDAAALLSEDAQLGTALRDTVAQLVENGNLRRQREEKIRGFAVPDANKRIFLDIQRLIREKK